MSYPQEHRGSGGDRADGGTLAGMPLALPAELRDLLTLQSGVLSRQQALSGGMAAAAIDNQLRLKRWQQLQRGVYVPFTGTPGWDAELWAAVLRAGAGAALSHRTAAELYGIAPPASGPIHVTVPSARRVRSIRGAVVHCSGALDAGRHPTLLPPRTRVEQTTLDLTQTAATFDEAFDWLCRAIGRRLTTPAHLRVALQARARATWRIDLLAALADVADGAQSPLERRYVREVERAHGLPAARRQARIIAAGRTRYLDNLYEEARLAVELDGKAAHPPEQRWADSKRDAAHAMLGILTVRYNWADVTTRPCVVAAQVAQLLEQRGTVVTLRRCGTACQAGPPWPAGSL